MTEKGSREEPSVKDLIKENKKLERRIGRLQAQLENYELLVDRTQHLLNTHIEEIEAAHREIAEQKAELELSENRFRQLADAAFETIIVHAGGRIVDCNGAAEILYGYRKEQLVGMYVHELVDPEMLHAKIEWIEQPTEKPIEGLHRRAKGTVPVEVRSRAIKLKGIDALVTVVRDISEHKEMEAYLKKMAESDPLTGVGNRRFFLDRGAKECGRSTRYGHPMSVVMMDIDKFKSINDAYGHHVGDLALKAMAHICVETLRDCDIFARLGGEEFAAILPETDLAGAIQLAERLRQVIEAMVTVTDRGEIHFTCSFGVTQLHHDTAKENIEKMLSRADKGLYEAKASGRNRVISV